MTTLVDRVVLFRYLLVVLVFGAATVVTLSLGPEHAWRSYPFVGLATVLVVETVLAILYLVLLLRLPRLRLSRNFLAAQYVVDAALLAVPVAVSGGVHSPFIVLYALLVIVAALTHSGRFGVTLALVVTALLAVLGYFAVQGALPGVPAARDFVVVTGIVTRILSLAVLFLVGAWVVGGLAGRLRQTDLALRLMRRDYALVRELHRLIVDTVPSGIALLDGEGRVLLLNPAGTRILGALGPKRARRELLTRMAEAAPGTAHELQLAGRERTIGYTVVRLDSDVSPGGRLVVFQDVTERKRLERELETQRRLAALGQLAANLAHELRNPLAGIANALQLFEKDRLGDEERSRLLAIQRREIGRLERLVREFLEYARPRTPRWVPVELGEATRRVLERLRYDPAAEGKRLVDAVAVPLQVTLDPELWEQLLGNLVLNALQWTPAGGTVTVEVAERDGEVGVAVRDEGPGIPPEDRGRIFEPFFGRREGGSGLGLAVAWSAAQAMGMHLELVETGPGGTRFEVRWSMQHGETANGTG